MELLLPCLYSFMGCVGYCLVFNIRMRKRMLLLASLGGAVGWCVYLLCGWLQNDITQSFAAILAVAAYSEIMARLQKSPATVYLIVGLIPLVPGATLYYAMSAVVQQDWAQAQFHGYRVTAFVLGIAAGVSLTLSLFEMLLHAVRHAHAKKQR